MSTQKIKAANDRLTAEWKQNDVIREYNTLDQKLSKEGSEYNQNSLLNNKTLKEIADELKKEHISDEQDAFTKNHDISSIHLAGDYSHNDTSD